MSTEVCHSRDLHHGDASVLSNNTVLPDEHNHGAQHPDQSDKQPTEHNKHNYTRKI